MGMKISFWILELTVKSKKAKNFFVKHIVLIFWSNQDTFFCKAYYFNFFPSQNSTFFQSIKILSNVWLGIENLKNAKHLKTLSEELMPIAWHLKRCWKIIERK